VGFGVSGNLSTSTQSSLKQTLRLLVVVVVVVAAAVAVVVVTLPPPSLQLPNMDSVLD
jgi:hypothetical protein